MLPVPLPKDHNSISRSVADAYSYEALPSGHIRYLLLQPGESGDPIICSLHVTELEDPTPYQAISYVWGTPDQTEPIECDGKTIYITVNLWDALVGVRRPDEALALWSDSICINQADNAEKAQQVSLMADIYRKSTRTLICFGSNDAGKHAEAAAGMITTINQLMDKIFRDGGFPWEPDSFPDPPADEPLLSDPRWESFATLTNHPWFSRCWVVQEAALSPVAEIIWGGVRMDWLQFLRAYLWGIERATVTSTSVYKTQVNSWLHLAHLQMRLPRESKTLVNYPLSFTLLQVLDFARSLGVTDPRDRIYACMNLPHSGTIQAPRLTALKPNYNKGYVQVCHDFACASLETSEMDLDLLGYTQNFGHTDPAADCPSWVPLWHVNQYFATIYRGTRRHSSQFPGRVPSLPCLVDRNILKVRGVLIGSVQHVTERFARDSTFETFGRVWREVEDLGTSSHLGNNPYHASARKAFVRTLAAANYRGNLDQWLSFETAYMDYIERKTSEQMAGADIKTLPSAEFEEDNEDSIARVVHNVIMYTAYNRKFVVSDRGYYGLVPFTAEKGDIICIIFGARAPCLLRRAGVASPGGVQQYKLLGDMFMFSARGAETGDLLVALGDVEGSEDWQDWDLQEQDILIC